MSSQVKHCYEFGPFRVDAAERMMFCEGALVPLPPKAFDILLLLVEKSGHLLEKSELMDAVWPDTFVEEANLTQNIFTLRKILSKKDKERLFIETVAKRGYRFIAPVKVLEQTAPAGAGERPATRLAALDENSPDEAIKSLAILPFVNASSDGHAEYLSDGITESIINSLSQLSHMRVMARSTVFRYKGQELDPREIGRQLGVGAVMVGRILSHNERLIIRTELVDVEKGWQLWGAQYNRRPSDLFDVQEEVARQIASNLRIKLTSHAQQLLTKRYTEHTEAYHLYLRGRFFWNKYTKEGLEKGIELFQQAIELDPNYALAYAGIADAYQRISNLYRSPVEVVPKAKAAAHRALEIDELLPESHTSLGLLKMYYDYDWEGAEREFQRAIELNSLSPLAHQLYGSHLKLRGRFDESLKEYKLALKFDPLSLQLNVNVATNLLLMGEYESATKQLKKIEELDANYCPALLGLGFTYLSSGDFRGAIEAFKRAWQLDKNAYAILGFLGHAYGVAGRRGQAQEVLEELLTAAKQKYVSSYGIAITYLGLGERDEALRWLQKSYEERNDFMVWLNVAPELATLRPDIRFARLLRRVGFTNDRS